VFVFPRPSSTEIHELYERYHNQATFFTPPTATASLRRLVLSAEKFRSTGRWLDVGYGEGGLLTIAAEHGWTCYGIEISGRALEHGRRQGWSVSAEPSMDARFARSTFDVVTMIECLEHQSAPLKFLEESVEWLRPEGLLYLTTPNVQSLNCRLLGVNWSIVCPPEHIVLWTAGALRRVLERFGLQILSIRAEGCNPSEMLTRVRLADGGGPPVDRNRAGVALSETLARTRLRRAFKGGVNKCLSALALGDTLKVSAQRRV
jgi:SAM-dependent methyltransferase